MTDTKPLGEVVRIRKGKKAAEVHEQRVNGSKPYIQIDEVRGTPPTRFASDPKGVEVSANDLCIVWDGANAGTVGYGIDGVVGSTLARMRLVQPDEWDTRFIGRLLQGKFQELNTEARGRGATIPHVNKPKLEAISLPCITRKEQQRIAAILDKADSIRRKREQALTMAGDALESAYRLIVGHKNPHYANWEAFSIEQLAENRKGSIRSGPFGSALKHGEFVDHGVAVLGIDNAVHNKFSWAGRRFITEEKYDQLRRYRVLPNDVIVTIMGTIGRSAVVPEDIPEAITTKHLATITCNTELMHPGVLSFAIHSDPKVIGQMRSQSKGAIMDGLNLGIIRKLTINLPPIEEQLRFVSILEKARAMQDRLAKLNASDSELFECLRQRAFRGEL